VGKVGLGYLGSAHTCNSAFPHLFFWWSRCAGRKYTRHIMPSRCLMLLRVAGLPPCVQNIRVWRRCRAESTRKVSKLGNKQATCNLSCLGTRSCTDQMHRFATGAGFGCIATASDRSQYHCTSGQGATWKGSIDTCPASFKYTTHCASSTMGSLEVLPV
jgi:hypothetical protein